MKRSSIELRVMSNMRRHIDVDVLLVSIDVAWMQVCVQGTTHA